MFCSFCKPLAITALSSSFSSVFLPQPEGGDGRPLPQDAPCSGPRVSALRGPWPPLRGEGPGAGSAGARRFQDGAAGALRSAASLLGVRAGLPPLDSLPLSPRPSLFHREPREQERFPKLGPQSAPLPRAAWGTALREHRPGSASQQEGGCSRERPAAQRLTADRGAAALHLKSQNSITHSNMGEQGCMGWGGIAPMEWNRIA